MQTSHDPELLDLKRKNVQLRRAKEEAESENNILKGKVDTLTIREQKLSKTAADQKFELEQLRQQIEALADLPAERDNYKKQVDDLKSEVVKLQLELKKYQEGSCSPQTAPATNPAADENP